MRNAGIHKLTTMTLHMFLPGMAEKLLALLGCQVALLIPRHAALSRVASWGMCFVILPPNHLPKYSTVFKALVQAFITVSLLLFVLPV